MKRKTILGLLLLTTAAFALRLAYLLHSHPFIDEFTTVLAARAILQRGLPVLPSGLFYEHGLLFSCLDAPFVGLADERMMFAIARLPSLLIGTVTVPLLYRVGRRWLSDRAGLVAAALLAFSPEGMVWGGRARMYALAQLLVLLLAFLVYEGSRGEGRARLRKLALLTLLATLLTQFGAMILVLPLVAGGLVVSWLTRPDGARPWFLRRVVLAEGAALAVVIGLGVLVKRLGQPVGAAPLGGEGAANLLLELWHTVTYQAGLALDGSSAVKFLARQFGVPHHLWLTLIAVFGGLLGFVIWISNREVARQRGNGATRQQGNGATGQRGNEATSQRISESANQKIRNRSTERSRRGPQSKIQNPKSKISLLYLWLVFGLTVVEMVTLLEPWRRNPRYLVMALPLFYLIVAAGLEQTSNLQFPISSLSLVIFVVVQIALLAPDLRIAYRTPEPAYEEAFQYVADQWQPGDVLLTMNTSGAGLYLGQADFFAVQENAAQFLLNADSQPVDRWLGAPWLGAAADLNRVLNEHPRTWFVTDTIRLPVYYRGDWLAIVGSQMDLIWSGDEALVYRTRPGRIPVPDDPDALLDVRFGGMIALKGYSLTQESGCEVEGQASPCEAEQALYLKPGANLHITLFWQALTQVDADYTIFIHLRDEQGEIVAQRDSQPFDGTYSTSQWQEGETVIQSLDVDLPPDLTAGAYSLYVGLYRLDTMTRLPVDDDLSGENALILDEVMLAVEGK